MTVLNQIFVENMDDMFVEERKDDIKYHRQAEIIYNQIKNIIETQEPYHDAIFSCSPLPFDISFIFAPYHNYDAVYKYRKNTKESIIVINCKNYKELYQKKEWITILKKMKPWVIHEIIHFLDIDVRNIRVHDSDIATINDPIEFNAYFQQITHKWFIRLYNILDSSDPYKDFGEVIGDTVRVFHKKIIDQLKTDGYYKWISQDNIFRWNKRIYDLYFNLRDRMIQQLVDDETYKDIKKL